MDLTLLYIYIYIYTRELLCKIVDGWIFEQENTVIQSVRTLIFFINEILSSCPKLQSTAILIS
jgi:hypothetical protein